MTAGEAKKRLNAYLLDSGLDPEAPTYRAFTILCLGYDAKAEQYDELLSFIQELIKLLKCPAGYNEALKLIDEWEK